MQSFSSVRHPLLISDFLFNSALKKMKVQTKLDFALQNFEKQVVSHHIACMMVVMQGRPRLRKLNANTMQHELFSHYILAS